MIAPNSGNFQITPGDTFLFGTEPNAWLKAHAHAFPPGGRVLSVADGEGRNSVWLARQGFAVDAFDIAEAGVAKARRLAEQAGVTVNYAVADGDALAWPEAAYDGVAAIFVQFADPAQRARLFANIAEAMEGVPDFIVERQLEHFEKVHPDYAAGVRAALSR